MGASVGAELEGRRQYRAEVALSNVRRTLGGRAVLDGLELRVGAASRLGIVGRSGAGKSTLLSLIAGLDNQDAGVVSTCGEESAAGRLLHCALMLQRDCLLPWRTALDNAGVALENRGLSRKLARQEAAALFAEVGLAGAERLRPAQLSGGMRQRIAFVRTLLAGKDVLLLDEPFGALDALTRAELQEWLRATLAEHPRTVVLVTHDVEEALLLCDRVAVLAHGRVGTMLTVDLPLAGTRREIVANRDFVELRERALEAIE